MYFVHQPNVASGEDQLPLDDRYAIANHQKLHPWDDVTLAKNHQNTGTSLPLAAPNMEMKKKIGMER